jgi:predicted nucleotidyltransferase
MDVYGFGIPPKDYLFPHLAGVIKGFGNQGPVFDQFMQHHIKDGDKEYDLTIFNIVKFFQLCMEGNPNMVDALFVPDNCVIYTNQIGNIVRHNRKIFLHKDMYWKFQGYAKAQLHKMKSVDRTGKRAELYELYGFDCKFAMHLVRLCLEIEQILTEGDLTLNKHSEILKSIRRGEWNEQQVRDWFAEKEKFLEKLYHENTALPQKPREDEVRAVLMDCLRYHYGDLTTCVNELDKYEVMVRQIREIVK